MVGGGPIAPAGQTVELLRAFERDAAVGRRVVMTGVSQAQVKQLREAGYRALQIGVEAFVDPARFTLVGPAGAQAAAVDRTGAARRLAAGRRRGRRLVAVGACADRRRRARLARASAAAAGLRDDARAAVGAPEDERALFVLARDPDGEVASFLRFARYRDGLSLDAMRRAQNGPNGLCEAMVAVGLMRAADEGAREVRPSTSPASGT